MEKKLGAKYFPGGLGRLSPRDQPPLEKDILGKQAHLGLWGAVCLRKGDFRLD